MAYYEHYSSVNNSGTIGMQLQARENIDEWMKKTPVSSDKHS